MKTEIRSQSKAVSTTFLGIKIIVFISWLLYMVLANTFDILIEAYLVSIGLGVVSYFVFGKKLLRKNDTPPNNNRVHSLNEYSSSNNYLSVFFHSNSRSANY